MIRASPRFLQVFRSQKQHLLSQLAFCQYHPQIRDDVRKLGKATMFRHPDLNTVHQYFNLVRQLAFYESPQMPEDEAINVFGLAPTIHWFVQDYSRYALQFIVMLRPRLQLKQDMAVRNPLATVEHGRIQKAFVRFETFRYLFAAEKNAPLDDTAITQYERRFMMEYAPDEAEEVACIRDYMVRRLWEAFKDLEDDALEEPGSDGPIRRLGQTCQPFDWFSRIAKVHFEAYIEYLISCGLPFLRRIFEAKGLDRAKLIILNSYQRIDYISGATQQSTLANLSQNSDFDNGQYDGEAEYDGEGLDTLSQGLLWANRERVPTEWGRPQLKGLRDWGYVFWTRDRLGASGILDRDPQDVAMFRFWEKSRHRESSVEEILESPHPRLLRETRKRARSNPISDEPEFDGIATP
ncbi:MAG: hypothetical protein Q9183_003111 [Haloplaca sp. 2 TL-2023]